MEGMAELEGSCDIGSWYRGVNLGGGSEVFDCKKKKDGADDYSWKKNKRTLAEGWGKSGRERKLGAGRKQN